jgi:hypothetical protein
LDKLPITPAHKVMLERFKYAAHKRHRVGGAITLSEQEFLERFTDFFLRLKATEKKSSRLLAHNAITEKRHIRRMCDRFPGIVSLESAFHPNHHSEILDSLLTPLIRTYQKARKNIDPRNANGGVPNLSCRLFHLIVAIQELMGKEFPVVRALSVLNPGEDWHSSAVDSTAALAVYQLSQDAAFGRSFLRKVRNMSAKDVGKKRKYRMKYGLYVNKPAGHLTAAESLLLHGILHRCVCGAEFRAKVGTNRPTHWTNALHRGCTATTCLGPETPGHKVHCGLLCVAHNNNVRPTCQGREDGDVCRSPPVEEQVYNRHRHLCGLCGEEFISGEFASHPTNSRHRGCTATTCAGTKTLGHKFVCGGRCVAATNGICQGRVDGDVCRSLPLASVAVSNNKVRHLCKKCGEVFDSKKGTKKPCHAKNQRHVGCTATPCLGPETPGHKKRCGGGCVRGRACQGQADGKVCR